MATCVKCSNPIPNRIEINGKQRVLSSRTHCLICIPFGTKVRRSGPERCICKTCGRTYEYYWRHGHTKNKCNSCMVNGRRTEVKKRMVEYKGGKCVVCGYNRHMNGFTFHHLRDKKFMISGNHTRAWEIIQRELDKCVLLCHNCHSEVHAGIVDLADIIGPVSK